MPDAKWLEVSLTVDPELAEAVSEVLSRFVSGGVVVESDVKYMHDEDEGTPFGPVRVFGYLAIDEQIDETRRRWPKGCGTWGVFRRCPNRSTGPLSMKIGWQPGSSTTIQSGGETPVDPAGVDRSETGEMRIPVKIDPSMAFGTGTHPTTQLCMAMLEEVVMPGKAVIDVGCGSGILSIGALKLGAGHALGVDIDNAAIISTRENAAANGVLERLEVGIGSVSEILAGKFSLRQAPLVLANILAPVIIRLFEAGWRSWRARAGRWCCQASSKTRRAG